MKRSRANRSDGGRRRFLWQTGALAASIAVRSSLSLGAELNIGTPSAEKLGWSASVQQFTYRRFPLFDALDLAAKVGLRNIELKQGLRLDRNRPGVSVNEDMPADARKDLKARLADSGVAIPSVFADFDGKPDQAKKVFECWKELGTSVIVSEPPAEAFDIIEKLCEEHQMSLAIHNHQKGHSKYWSPDLVLAACKGRSQRIGGCCDCGQWARSGLDPVACLRQLKERIISFHLKDIAKKGDVNSRNTVMGEGEAECDKALEELHRLKYKGLVTIDFEHDTPALQDDMARNVAFIENQAKRLLGG
jgi:sugar phosphate isomerase/epimerase